MTKEIIAGVVALAGVAGGGWQANEYLHRTFARLEMVLVAGNKADYLMDQRIEELVAQIAWLERKRNKTPGELQNLEYLRDKLDRLRKVQRGK